MSTPTASERTVKFDPSASERTTGTSERGTIISKGSNILSKLFKNKSSRRPDGYNDAQDDDTETADTFTDSGALRKTRTMRKKAGKSRGAIQAELHAEEEQRQRDLQESLNVSERGYLPVHVRTKLLELNGLPATPHTEGSRGVVLFADISGFTNLGKELRSQMTALEAASKLANRICAVLRELTDICHEYEGDVAKFAGDALLCVWENHEDTWMLERAKTCAVAMLGKIKEVDTQLDLHGGIAMGNILHFHLGDKRQDQLWYLVTGDAVVRAANLVDEADRGQILYEPRRSESDAGLSNNNNASSHSLINGIAENEHGQLRRLPSTMAYEVFTKESKTLIAPTLRRQKSRQTSDDQMPLSSPSDSLGQGRRLSTDYPENRESLTTPKGTRLRTSTEDDPFLNMRITPRGRSYIPRALKNILMSGRIESGEMRSRVAVLFAALPSLTLREDEITANSVSTDRRRLVNDTFGHISTILRQLDGAFRDLLFDDKGCIFIAVFGAYGAIEMPELKALKAARRMEEELEVDDLKIGLSVGTCFVGLVGNDVRHDMIVMGHEVNMAARFMSKAVPGTILVGPRIQRVTQDFYKFESVQVQLKKKQEPAPGNLQVSHSTRRFESHENDLTGDGATDARRDSENVVFDPNGMVTAYRPVKEMTKRASFTTTYRYSQIVPDSFFVGRKAEINKMIGHLNKATTTKTGGSVCMVSGPRGYGKSWLIREFRHRMDDKYSSALGVAFELNVLTPLYVFRQIFEHLFEIFDGMPKSRGQAVLAQWRSGGIVIDPVLLEKYFPYLTKFLPQPRKLSVAAPSMSARLGRIMGSMRFTSGVLNLPEEGGVNNGGGEGETNSAGGASAGATTLRSQTSREKSRERSSSTGAVAVGGNAVVEEIKGSASPLRPNSLAATPSNLVEAAIAQADEPRGRLISTRSLLLNGTKKPSSTRNVMAETPPGPAPLSSNASPTTGAMNTPAALAAALQQQQLSLERESKEKEKKILARKTSRPEMSLVMGKKELDALVNFVTTLLEIASKDVVGLGKKGLLIIVEDLQWLDSISLQVLLELIDKMCANPKGFLPNVLLVLACRNPDPDKPDEEYYSSGANDMRPLLEQRLLDSAQKMKLSTSVELDVLARDEVDSLVSKLLIKGTGDTVSQEVLDLVYNNSGGMPNAIADVISLIKQNEGAIYLDAHSNSWKWKTAFKDGKHDGGQSVLREARQAFVLRVDNLSLATRDLLKIAACLCDDKQKFKLHQIAEIITRDLENKSRYLRADTHVPSVDYISEKLQEAVVAGLLKHRKAGIFSPTEEWAFVSYAIAGTVLDMVPTDRLNEIREMKDNIEKEKNGQAAEGLFRDFLGAV